MSGWKVLRVLGVAGRGLSKLTSLAARAANSIRTGLLSSGLGT